MRLIVDSNVVMSALIKDSITREIILRSGIEFFHPKIALKNLDKYRSLILEKSGLDGLEYEDLFKLILSKISLIDLENFIGYLEESNDLMRGIDIEDSPFIALALSFENDGIWSDDSHFKKQNKINIWTTKELLDIEN